MRTRAVWVWMCHPLARQIISHLVVLAHNYILCIKQLIVLLVADIVAAVQRLLTGENKPAKFNNEKCSRCVQQPLTENFSLCKTLKTHRLADW